MCTYSYCQKYLPVDSYRRSKDTLRVRPIVFWSVRANHSGKRKRTTIGYGTKKKRRGSKRTSKKIQLKLGCRRARRIIDGRARKPRRLSALRARQRAPRLE